MLDFIQHITDVLCETSGNSSYYNDNLYDHILKQRVSFADKGTCRMD